MLQSRAAREIKSSIWGGFPYAVNVSRLDDAGFNRVTYNKHKSKNSTIMMRPPRKLIIVINLAVYNAF